jgi:DEAD/DEAH box helicase
VSVPPVSLQIVQEKAEKLPGEFARLYSNYSLKLGGRPSIAYWDPAEAESGVSEALRLASLGLCLDDDAPEKASAAFRRAAELFEWLSVEGDSSEYFFVSALLYQIAGFPAIARTISAPHERDLLWHFVRSDFSAAQRAWLDSANLLGDEPSRIQHAGTPKEFFASALISVVGTTLASLRWDENERVSKAIDMLDDVATFFQGAQDDVNWLLAALFAKTVRNYVSTSLRNVCAPLVLEASPAGRSAFERYFRESYRSGRILAWPSQARGVEAIVSGRDFAMCTPTGSGKTTVAELSIMQALFSGSGSFLLEPLFGRLVLYIVPSRALAFEVERRLRRAFSHVDSFPVQVVSSYGGSDISPFEHWVESNNSTVVVCTQEKADALLRSHGELLIGKLSLLIVDEAHSVIAHEGRDFSRAFRLESLFARIRSLLPTSQMCRVIALSAVLPDASELSRWVGEPPTGEVSVDYRSTRQALGRLTMNNDGAIQVQYDMLNGLPLGENSQQYRPTLIDFVPRFLHVGERAGLGPEVQLRALSLWVAAHLAAFDRPESGAVLITVGSQINNYAKDFVMLSEAWGDLPRFFDEEEASRLAIYRSALAACADYFGESSYERALLERGIIVHHGKLPIRMSQLFTQIIESGVVRIIVATSTLSEGINLPFETILFPSLRLVGFEDMSAEYVKNVIGRAGRPGVAREGRALVLTGTGTRFTPSVRRYRRLVDTLSRALVAEPAKSPLGLLTGILFRYWKQLTGDADYEQFCEWLEQKGVTEHEPDAEIRNRLDALDSFIIAAIAELAMTDEAVLDETSAVLGHLSKTWDHTFLHAIDPQSLSKFAFLRRSEAVVRAYKESATVRKSYYASLGPRSATLLSDIEGDISMRLREGFEYYGMSAHERLTFIESLVRVLSPIPEFSIEQRRRGPGWETVLRWWMRLPDAAIPTADKVGEWYSFANESFAYRFSWAINSAINSLLPRGGPPSLFEGRLAEAGLPRLVLWFRDMMSNGCLDPVQAAVYSAGLSTTREDARELALKYYATTGMKSDEVYEPQKIMQWLARVRATPTVSERELHREFPLSYLAPELGSSVKYRVFPVVRNEAILWRDLAGYPIASSNGIAVELDADRYDYELDCETRAVTQTPYL